MEDLVVEEICKNLKWNEKIIVKVFKKTFIKMCDNLRVLIINIIFKR